MTFGSLFAGIGGMDLGLERAGMTCSWQVEIDPYARRVLERHWPDVRRWDDVRTFPPPGEWGVDLICGGFPCQDISFAGKGAGLAGERSGLWYEFARVVRDLRPRYVLVENVSALRVRGLDAVLGTLALLGYDAEWSCLSACAMGAPHTRDRMFIVAHPPQERRFFDFAQLEVAPKDEQAKRWLRKSSPKPFPADLGFYPDSPDWRMGDGFPGWLERIEGLGNAVYPDVAEWIGRRILEADGGER